MRKEEILTQFYPGNVLNSGHLRNRKEDLRVLMTQNWDYSVIFLSNDCLWFL
jgi:hypothetical protein